MRQVITALIAMTWLMLPSDAQAQPQPQPPPQPKTATVGFTNMSSVSVLVKGYTVVNGVQKAGQIMQLKKNGGRAFESNVPVGVRYYWIYDANQPDRVLLRDHPVPIQNPNVLLDIVPMPGNPNRLMIVPAGSTPPPAP